METILETFRRRNWWKTRLKLKFFSCHNINMVLLWLILKWYTILEDFFLLDSVHYHDDVKTTLKVWLVQSQDPDVRLISQIDIVMCFIYNISAMSWGYRGWYHSNIVTISECPLGPFTRLNNLIFMQKATIMFIIFWDFLMVDQIFLSQQVKRSLVISNKLYLRDASRVA